MILRHAARLPFGYGVEVAWTPPARLDVHWSPDGPEMRAPRHRRHFVAPDVAAPRP